MRDMEKRRFLGGFLAGVLFMCVIGLFAAAIFINVFVGRTGMQALSDVHSGKYVSLANGDGPVNAQSVSKLQMLSEVIDRYYYYADDLSKEDMEEALYKGMMNSTGDVYTEYYTAEEFEILNEDTQGIFYGIGCSVSIDELTRYPMIMSVNPGSGAEEAGIEAGDIIYEVEGESMEGYSLTDAVNLIRGEKDTEVNLTMVRNGELLKFAVVRGPVDETKVYYGILENNIGYIEIVAFDRVAASQFTDAMKDLDEQGIDALLIDLRGNPGGDVDTVVSIANDLLPEGLVFYSEDRDGRRTEYKCSGEHEFVKPLAVLVNSFSASASEILSGAIQDSGMGILVGTTTYGKGVVQSVLPLSDGSGIKITTSAYFTRNGRDINHVGITPDVEVELDIEAYRKDRTDNQFEEALTILYKQLGIEAEKPAS